jgi:hypothetical protein
MGHSRLHRGEPPADLPGQLGIAGERRGLVLPEVEIAARQGFEVRRFGLRRFGHGGTIQSRPRAPQ